MRQFLARFTGIALILASILGLVVSISGILFVIQYKQNIETQMTTAIDLLDSTLMITSDGFGVINDALGQTSKSTLLLGEITTDLGNSLSTSSPALRSIGDLVGTDLVSMIDSAQDSLTSAQASAKVIDDTLKIVSMLSFGASAPKANEKSLSVSLGEIAVSMENLPQSLKQVQRDINNTNKNLQLMQTGIYDLSDAITEVDATIADAQKVIDQYSGNVDNLRGVTRSLKTSLPNLLDKGVLGFTLMLVWMAIAQIGLFTQGLELLTRKPTLVAVPVAETTSIPAETEPGQPPEDAA